jgi:hypothetical protein
LHEVGNVAQQYSMHKALDSIPGTEKRNTKQKNKGARHSVYTSVIPATREP